MNEPKSWIIVSHWERFQHYKDRNPPWVKNYVRLLSDPNYGQLTHAQRSTLHGLWLMYAASDRQIPDSTAWITRQLGVRVTRATLVSLNHAGFIHFSASKPLAPRATSRETELTYEKELTYEEKLDQASYPQAADEEELFDYEKINILLREMP